MVIGPCVIKTRLSAWCLGFREAGTAAAGIRMLRAVGAVGLTPPPKGSIQEPPVPMGDFSGETEGQTC